MESETPVKINWKKYAIIGGSLAIGWFLLFVIGGASWSLTHTKTLGVIEHIHNGIVFAKLMNVLSLLGGCSIGVYALFHISKKPKQNFGILGFELVHFTIVILLWVVAPFEFRKDPLPERMLDRVFEFKEKVDSQD